jgi:hypothetical protein
VLVVEADRTDATGVLKSCAMASALFALGGGVGGGNRDHADLTEDCGDANAAGLARLLQFRRTSPVSVSLNPRL